MKQMPDQTYPNSKIVLCIMGCVDRLTITRDYLAESDLEQTLEHYKDGYPGKGYAQCQQLAKSILNKWYRKKLDIATTYDPEGRFDEGWRDLQRTLDKERSKVKRRDDDSEDEAPEGGDKKKGNENINSFLDSNQRQRQMNFTKRPVKSSNLNDDDDDMTGRGKKKAGEVTQK